MKKSNKKVIADYEKISLDDLKKWSKENIPKGAKNITFKIEKENEYSYSENVLIGVYAFLVASWEIEIK